MVKKRHIFILGAGLSLLGAHATQAQISIGPRLGLNASTIGFDVGDDAPDSELLFAPQAGLTLNAQFGNFSMQPSLLFSQKGGKFVEKLDETNTGNSKTYRFKREEKGMFRLSYLEVPVNLVYNTAGATGGFQVFAGPYLGVGIGGKYELEVSRLASVDQEVVYSYTNSEEADIKFTSKNGNSGSNDTEFRRLDWGFNAGVGYKAGPFQAQLGYGLGLGNLLPDYDDDSKDNLHNRGVHFSVAYFFGAK